MTILGIETSCDETAAAIVRNGTEVLSNVIASSADMHSQTGGVVPEVAAREHLRAISPTVDKALAEAKVDWSEVDAIAVTYAPGLIASLLVGVNTAQTLAYLHQKPLLPVYHISGHIYANFLGREAPSHFPILVLTVSGGHNELVLMRGHHDFEVIGETLDDAAGEAFDKVARLLGLGFPGGPIISKRAEQGDANAFDLPRVMLDEENKYNFSFSGLKSAVMREIQKLHWDNESISDQTINDLAASFQMAVIEVLVKKLARAAQEFQVQSVHLAGGVSANRLLRKLAEQTLSKHTPLFWPKEMIYCTDNAAMIAGAAYFLPNKKGNWKDIQVSSQAEFPVYSF